ncbi:MAG: TonB-dependent receptor plug [Gemmatimonadetes bacterium]|nr:TonB-dependent receptor plug [Gemmatimonadota bacterium]
MSSYVRSASPWNRVAACVAAALIVVGPAPRAWAMTAAPRTAAVSAAGLTGLVKDSAGHPVSSVLVILAQLNRTATTNDEGVFRFVSLPAGTYHVATQRIGFAPGHADVTIPATGADVRVTITLSSAAVELTNVQVTATVTGSDPRDVPQSVTSLSGQDLARQMGGTVAQTLAREPGISMRYSGPAATAPVIRGLQGERILVLQDGDRAADLSSAAPDHGVSVDPLTAQRIEVVRGPASLLYGNQALGGVVNVISNDIPTSIPTHVDGYIAGQTESATPGGAVAGGATIPLSESFALVARGGARRTNDLLQGGDLKLPNTFYNNYNGVGGFGFATNAATGGLIYRGYKFDYGLPSAAGERAKIDGTRHEIVGRSDFTLNTGALTSLRVSATGQWYQHAEINQETGNTNTSFKLKTQTLDVLGRTRAGRVSGAVGVSGLFKQYAALGEEALTPAANSNGLGAFVFQEIALGAHVTDPDARVAKLQLGGRADAYKIDVKGGGDEKFDAFVGNRTFNQFSGSVGLSIPLGAHATLAGSAARAFRAPSVEELSSNAFHAAAGTYDVGNPTLKAEVNQGFDAILRVEGRRVNGQIAGFYNDIANYITPNIVGDTTIAGDAGPTTVPLNRISQADATLRGVEGRLEVEVLPHIVLGGMGDLVHGELKSTKTALPFIPASRLGGLARWTNGAYSASAEYRHAFAQNRVPPAVSPDDPSGLATAAYDLLDLSIGFTLPMAGQLNSIVLRVDNALDEQYVDATSRIKSFAFNPGRNVALVYKLMF